MRITTALFRDCALCRVFGLPLSFSKFSLLYRNTRTHFFKKRLTEPHHGGCDISIYLECVVLFDCPDPESSRASIAIRFGRISGIGWRPRPVEICWLELDL